MTDLGGIEELASNVLSGCQQPFYVFTRETTGYFVAATVGEERRACTRGKPDHKKCALACYNARIAQLSTCAGREYSP